jgi:hypothetical protein
MPGSPAVLLLEGEDGDGRQAVGGCKTGADCTTTQAFAGQDR